MVRTQIYLTDEEQSVLRQLAAQTGKKQSQIIREAVDALLTRKTTGARAEMMKSARGIWEDRNDDYLSVLRQEADRELPR